MYREMKDSGVQWIGNIPKEWRVIKVKMAFKRKNIKAMSDNPIILSLTSKGIKVRDITNNEGQIAESYYNYNPVEIGDLLLNPMDLVTNAFSSVSSINGVISPAYFNLKALEGYNAKYYDYYFKLQYWGLAFFAHGKGVSFENRWTLNNETLMNYKIPYPSINEQNLIVEFLEKKLSQIDDIILKQKSLIEKYKTYKQSLITETVTKGLDKNVPMKDSGIEWIGEIPSHWDIKKMKYLGSLNSSGVDKKIREGEKLYKSVHYVNVYKNEQKEIVNREDYLVISCDDNKADNCTLRRGDVLFTNSSETAEDMGVSTVVSEDLKDTLFGYHLMRFRPFPDKLWYKYEKYLFSSNYMRKWFEYNSVGMTRYGLAQRGFSEAQIIYAPYEEQKEISKFLDEKCNLIDSAISKKEQLIEKLESYKKSLIYECVTGKREVN